MRLISDQVTTTEIYIILRELKRVISDGVDGDIAELGCFVGTTSLFISEYLKKIGSDKTFYVYDSFAGLPTKSTNDNSPVGEQFKAGELKASKGRLIKYYKQANLPLPVITKGWFEDLTILDLPDKICLAFLDGDYYNSIISSLKLVWPKLSQGARVIIDDYANEALPGVQKAIDEWLAIHPANLRIEASMALLSVK